MSYAATRQDHYSIFFGERECEAANIHLLTLCCGPSISSLFPLRSSDARAAATPLCVMWHVRGGTMCGPPRCGKTTIRVTLMAHCAPDVVFDPQSPYGLPRSVRTLGPSSVMLAAMI